MSEYIEREKLIKHLEDEIEGCRVAVGGRSNGKGIAYGTALGLKMAKSFVETLPAVDVTEVRHGEWIVTENGCVINCSECGERLELCYPDGTEVRVMSCCPYCGAKMDGTSNRKKPVIIDGRCRCPQCKDNKSLLGLYCDNCGQAIDCETE